MTGNLPSTPTGTGITDATYKWTAGDAYGTIAAPKVCLGIEYKAAGPICKMVTGESPPTAGGSDVTTKCAKRAKS